MRRWELLLWLGLLVACCTPAYASGHDLNYEGWQDHYWEGSCSNPANQDRWLVREPTEEEIWEYGSGVLVFEYWNSEAKCSDTLNEVGVYYGEHRFVLNVELMDTMYDEREKITLVSDTHAYAVFDDPLYLDDGEKPGRIILYPALY